MFDMKIDWRIWRIFIEIELSLIDVEDDIEELKCLEMEWLNHA